MSSVFWPYSSKLESGRVQRRPPLLWLIIILALTLTGGLELGATLRSPGQRMHSELAGAAADLQSVMPIVRSDAMLVQLRRHFREHDASIDATHWPVVLVTLHHLDGSTCRDAADKVRRIEGPVVIELERYRAADECHDDNEMTWRIMP
jgi:hypothetical protein